MSVAQPRFGVGWSGRWQEFLKALRALHTPLPVLPAQVTLSAFRDAGLRPRWPGQALVLSAVLHVLFVVTP
ncbi:MAG: hypothetical protein ACE5HL_10535, partial [Terriglobia bacterium]